MSGNDELSTWFDTHYLTFTEAINDVEIQNTYADIAEYVSVRRGVVVTHGILAGPRTTKVKIPDICEHFDVSYVNVFEMMR